MPPAVDPSPAPTVQLVGNRMLARMLDPRPGAVLARCACGGHAPAGGTCSACAATSRNDEELVPEFTALRRAVAARRTAAPRTLARVCAPAADCAIPNTSLTEFVQQTESKPENQSKAAKRATNCGPPQKAACTADGHAGVATALTDFLKERSPSRLDYVSGVFVNKDMPADYGAVTVDCTTFTPPLPENGGKKFCTTVPDTLEAEAKLYKNPGIKTIGGVPRYTWVTRTLLTLTHETEHGRFDTAAGNSATTPLSGPSTGSCKPDDVESDLSEMAAQMSEFPILLHRIQIYPSDVRDKRLASWFDYHLNNGGEDVTGTLKSLRCKCECTDVDNYVKQVVKFAQAGWSSWEKWVYHTEMKKPEHHLNWPVDPPDAIDPADLPPATPVMDVHDLPPAPAKP